MDKTDALSTPVSSPKQETKWTRVVVEAKRGAVCSSLVCS